MNEGKNLVSDSKENETYEQENDKNIFDCQLYGTKYYCIKIVQMLLKLSLIFVKEQVQHMIHHVVQQVLHHDIENKVFVQVKINKNLETH